MGIVKKFLVNEEEKFLKLNVELAPLTEEKEALEKEWEQKQSSLLQSSEVTENNELLEKKIEELKANNTSLIMKIESLKKDNELKVLAEQQLISDKILLIKTEINDKQKAQAEKDINQDKAIS